jgi:phage terminase large subunit-like protein
MVVEDELGGNPTFYLSRTKAWGRASSARLGRSLPIQVCDPVKSKIERAAASAPLCEQGRVWLPAFYTPWREQWEKEVVSFPSSRFNDQVDAFSWALSWIFRIQRARHADAAFNGQMESFSLFR